MSEDKKEVTLDRMPGSDPIEDAQSPSVDLNFGLGEEPKAAAPVEQPEVAEEPVAEAPKVEPKAEAPAETPSIPELR